MTMLIPVICDRCRAEGVAGEAQFADFGDLLDFEPVPLQVKRVDGFSPEAQRAYVAALSILGSADRAAKAIGKSATGAQRLCTLPGSEGFRRACERAKAISLEKGTLRLAESLRAVAAAGAEAPPPEPAAEPDEPTDAEERAGLETIAAIVHKYLLKLHAERRCRLEGRIAEADFYVRQVTMLEVALDVVSGKGMAVLVDARLGGHDLLHIAETELSKLLDGYRRKHWEACGDPPRPEYPPRHLLVAHEGFSTEPLECTQGGVALSDEEQLGVFAERHAADAAAHIAWEAEARRDYERRRESAAAHHQEPRPAGQPAPSGDGTDVTNSVRGGPASEDRPESAIEGNGSAHMFPHKETEK